MCLSVCVCGGVVCVYLQCYGVYVVSVCEDVVCVYVCMWGVFTCVCVHIEAKHLSQVSVLRHHPPRFETGFFTGLEVVKSTRVADKGALGILLLLPHQLWKES